MTAVEITAKTADKGAVAVKYDFGNTLADLVKICSANDQNGEAVVLSNAKSNMVIKVQDLVRAGIKDGKSPAEIQKEVSAWVPGVKKRGKSKAEKLQEEFASLSPEMKKELLANLTSS